MEIVDVKILGTLYKILSNDYSSEIILHEVYLEGPPENPHYTCSYEVRNESKEVENITGLHYDGYYAEVEVSEFLQYVRDSKLEEILKCI